MKMLSENQGEINLYQNVFKGLIVNATYQKTGLVQYDGHPCIEALPAIKSEEQFLENVIHLPDYTSDYRSLSNVYRGHHIHSLFHLFLPTRSLLHLEQMISIVLRKGLIARNPRHVSLWRAAERNSKEMRDVFARKMVHYSRSSMLAFAVIGISGIGKSTAMRTILSQYPQVILHSKFKGEKFGFTQIVYLYVETPPDGSLKQLCLDILRSIDDILHTTYFHDYGRSGRATVHNLVGTIARVAALHTIGMLIIDEVQNLSVAKSGGAETMMNFFVLLVNMVNLPVVLIGTPLIYRTFGKEFRMGRRLAGQGDIIFNNFSEGPEWDEFVESVWVYQYTKKTTPLSPKIIKTFYFYSQGIIDVFIKLYALAQMRAITSGTEEVTSDLIKTVFHDYFQSLRPAIEALRSGDIKALATFPDIQPINIQTHIENKLIQNHQINLSKLLAKRKEQAKTITKPLVSRELIDEEHKENLAQNLASTSTPSEVENHSSDSEMLDVIKIPNDFKQVALVQIMEEGKSRGLDGYQSMLEAGLIYSPTEIGEDHR